RIGDRGLMSYGSNLADQARRAAVYIDKILKGQGRQTLPVEQPTKFELLVNLKTARELGLTISRDFLLIADGFRRRVHCSKLRHYSISSSARADRFPSALAVLRLITSSNFVDCITGRSPLRRPDVVSNRIADERIDEPTMPGAHQPARIDILTCS